VLNYFTDVSGEEAYYWLFSQHLDWGYLDHPPVLAFFIKPGYWLFHNNLGLRSGILVLSILTIIVLRKTLSVKNDSLYIWILLGLLPVHLGSLIVKTDVPLIFFTACFFFLYKQYLKEDNFKTIFLLSLCIVLMMLSKYHGVLVVFFTVLSNLSLFRKRSFYLVLGLSILFMLPHLYWQYRNNFASFQYHFYNRDDMGFKWTNISQYLWTQPLFLGPLTGFVLFAASAFQKTMSPFHRALKFNIAGVLIIFFILAFKLEIHKHWTSVLEVPLILLGHEYISEHKNWQRGIKYLSIVTLLILLPFRVFLAYDFLPAQYSERIEKLHNWNLWALKIKELSGGLPVMFIDQYEQASRYSYLSGDKVHCYNTFAYRETQHDFWPLEDSLQGKNVLVITRNDGNPLFRIDSSVDRVKIQYHVIENFLSFRKIKISMDEQEISGKAGESKTISLLLTNKYGNSIDFSKVGNKNIFLNAHFLKGLESIVNEKLDSLTMSILPDKAVSKTVVFKLPRVPGIYDLRFSIQVEGIYPSINSKKFVVRVEE